MQVQVGARLRVDLRDAGRTADGEGRGDGGVNRCSRPIRASAARSSPASRSRALPLNGARVFGAGAADDRRQLAGSSLTTGTRRAKARSTSTACAATFNNFLIDGVDNNAYGTSNQGFSNQVMQPSPDAVGEFKVVTNNMSAEYGRAAGATINVALPQRHQPVPRRGWEFIRDTALNATGLLQAGRRRQAGARPQPVRRRRRRPDRAEQGVLLRRLRRLPADAQARRRSRRIADAGAAPGHPRRRRAQPADRRRLSGRHADPDDARSRARCCAGCPTPTAPGTANNYRSLQEFTERLRTRPAARSTCRSAPTLSLFGRYGLRNAGHLRPAADSAAVGRRRQRRHLRAQQAVRRSARPGCRRRRRCSKCASAGRDTQAGKNPPALGSGERARGVTASPACRPTRASPAACRRSSSPATRTWAGRRPTRSGSIRRSTTRRSTTPGLQGAHSLKTGYEFQRINDRSAGREPALRPRHLQRAVHAVRPAPRPNNLYNLADFMLGLRAQLRAQQRARRRTCARTCTSPTCRTTGASSDRLTLNLGLRYEYATPYWESDNVLSNFDPATNTMVSAKDGSIVRPSAGQSRPQQLRAAPRLRLHADAAHGHPRRLRHQLRALQPRRRRQPAADQRPAGRQRRRQRRRNADGADVPADASRAIRRA